MSGSTRRVAWAFELPENPKPVRGFGTDLMPVIQDRCRPRIKAGYRFGAHITTKTLDVLLQGSYVRLAQHRSTTGLLLFQMKGVGFGQAPPPFTV